MQNCEVFVLALNKRSKIDYHCSYLLSLPCVLHVFVVADRQLASLGSDLQPPSTLKLSIYHLLYPLFPLIPVTSFTTTYSEYLNKYIEDNVAYVVAAIEKSGVGQVLSRKRPRSR